MVEGTYRPIFRETWHLLWEGLTKWPAIISAILGAVHSIVKLFLGRSPMIKGWIDTFPWWSWWVLFFVLVIVSFFRANHRKHKKSESKINGLQARINRIQEAHPEFTFGLSDDEQLTKLSAVDKWVPGRWYRIGVTNSSSVPAKKCHIDVFDIKPKPVNFTQGPLEVSHQVPRETDISPGASKSFALAWLRLDKVRPEQGFIPLPSPIALNPSQTYCVHVIFTAENSPQPIDGVYILSFDGNSITVDQSRGLGTTPNTTT